MPFKKILWLLVAGTGMPLSDGPVGIMPISPDARRDAGRKPLAPRPRRMVSAGQGAGPSHSSS